MATSRSVAVFFLALLAFAAVAQGEALLKLTDADFDTKVGSLELPLWSQTLLNC